MKLCYDRWSKRNTDKEVLPALSTCRFIVFLVADYGTYGHHKELPRLKQFTMVKS